MWQHSTLIISKSSNYCLMIKIASSSYNFSYSRIVQNILIYRQRVCNTVIFFCVTKVDFFAQYCIHYFLITMVTLIDWNVLEVQAKGVTILKLIKNSINLSHFWIASFAKTFGSIPAFMALLIEKNLYHLFETAKSD